MKSTIVGVLSSLSSVAGVVVLTTTLPTFDSAKWIEIFLYKGSNGGTTSKKSTYYSQNSQIVQISDTIYKASTTSATTTTSLLAKIKIPMEDIENISKYEYCKESDSVVTVVSSTAASTCKYQKINKQNSEEIGLANLSKYFLVTQHNSHLLNTKKFYDKESQSDEVKPSPAPAQCTEACKDCKCAETSCKDCCNAVEKDKKCCCCSKKITPITDDEKTKQFFVSISNLISSYSGTYFAPFLGYIYLENYQNSDFATATKKSNLYSSISTFNVSDSTQKMASDTPGTGKKYFRGSLVYGYFDYWYKRKKDLDLDEWIKKKYAIQKKTTTQTEKLFINFPVCYEYEIDDTKTSLKKSDQANSRNIFNLYEKYKNRSDLLVDGVDNLKSSLCCVHIGEINETDLTSDNGKDIFLPQAST